MKTQIVRPVLVDDSGSKPKVGDIVKSKFGDIHLLSAKDGREYIKTVTKQQLILVNIEPDECDTVGNNKQRFFVSTNGVVRVITDMRVKTIGKYYNILATQNELSPEQILMFISEYNKHLETNCGIKDVEIELEDFYYYRADKSHDWIKTDHHGFIEAYPSFYTKEEKQPKLNKDGFVTIQPIINPIETNIMNGLYQNGIRVMPDPNFYYDEEHVLKAIKQFLQGTPTKMVPCDEKGFYLTEPPVEVTMYTKEEVGNLIHQICGEMYIKGVIYNPVSVGGWIEEKLK